MRVKGLLPLLIIFLLAILLELTMPLSFMFPRPSEIFSRLIDQRDVFLFHMFVTFKEMAIGTVVAFLMAFALAWAMLMSQTIKIILEPIFIGIQCLPIFTIAPLLILTFGWSQTAIIIPTALMIFFPLTINLYKGISSTPQHLLDFFAINQASSWKLFFQLRLPWATPHIFSGMRIAAAIAGIGAVGGEWAGAQEGIGVLIQEYRRSIDFEGTYAALFCLLVVSLSFYSVVIAIEHLFFKKYSSTYRAM